MSPWHGPGPVSVVTVINGRWASITTASSHTWWTAPHRAHGAASSSRCTVRTSTTITTARRIASSSARTESRRQWASGAVHPRIARIRPPSSASSSVRARRGQRVTNFITSCAVGHSVARRLFGQRVVVCRCSRIEGSPVIVALACIGAESRKGRAIRRRRTSYICFLRIAIHGIRLGVI